VILDTALGDRISRLGAQDSMVAVIPIGVDALLLTNGHHHQLVELNSNIARAASFLQDPDRVVLFDNAKPFLRLLLGYGIDIIQPLCLKTLQLIVNPQDPVKCFAVAQTVEEAVRLAKQAFEYLERIQTIAQKKYRQLSRLENRVLRSFASMEYRGLYVDRMAWEKLIQDAKQKMLQLREIALENLASKQSIDLFGNCTINLDSSKEVKDALEKVVGYALCDMHQSTLSRLDHPAANAILQYREVAKVVQTYGDNFLCHIEDQSSRIHATFEPIGSTTGRVACHSPNLQNLPSGEVFHRCLAAPKHRSLITGDYAACELKILASLSQDPVFLDAFARDIDLHSEVATNMFGVSVDKQNNAHLRQRAKAINFGLMYGMGSNSLARSLHIGEMQAKQLFQQYFKTYPKVKRYLDSCVEKAIKNGYAETVLGRRLFFDKATLENKETFGEISRLAKNMPIQGTGAEIIKLALVRIHRRLTEEFKDAFLVNMIHDELVVECQDQDAEAVSVLVQKEMEGAQAFLIPNVTAKANVYAGKYWQH
jgi:DNA polymerase I